VEDLGGEGISFPESLSLLGEREKICPMVDTVAFTLTAGFLLDLLLGDPPWLPHPVRLIGRLVVWGEPRCRLLIANEYLAGAVFAFGVVIVAGVVCG
jgi:adenosylcobinamide-phosphate synthase